MLQHNGRLSTPVDSFVQLNLKRETPSIDIKLEDYKKVHKRFFVGFLLSSPFVVLSSLPPIQYGDSNALAHIYHLIREGGKGERKRLA